MKRATSFEFQVFRDIIDKELQILTALVRTENVAILRKLGYNVFASTQNSIVAPIIFLNIHDGQQTQL